MMWTRKVVWFGWGLLLSSAMVAQTATSPWVVRPEWVKAHEDFLASDAMQGRGSATHDEEVTATYVASEFEAYGLKVAPGMTSFLQSAQVIEPKLDGHATLRGAGLTATQGTDFDLLRSSGGEADGSLLKLPNSSAAKTHVGAGSAVLLAPGEDPAATMQMVAGLRHAGASLILLPEAGPMAAVFAARGNETSLPIRLAGTEEGRTSAVVLLRPAAYQKFAAEKDGEAIRLEVHPLEAPPRSTFNAVGFLPGTDPSAGTILLTAHLDHLGVGRPVNGDALYNGANDDAAGTTAVLELAHALAAGPPLRRSVLFVCYGSEEIGELGSTYFGEHPPVPLTQLVANLEFEMVGNQDPKMPPGTLLLTGWDRSDLGPTLKEHGALLGPDPYPEEHFFERSDNYALALKGVVAHTAAGWGTPPTYHQPDDDLAHLDLPFMTAAIQSLVEPVRWLASSTFVPKWNAGGRPTGR